MPKVQLVDIMSFFLNLFKLMKDIVYATREIKNDNCHEDQQNQEYF